MDDCINIKEQFKMSFFGEKKVKFQRELLLEYYDVVFPCSNEFEVFLSTSGRDAMVSSAMKIVERIMFEESFGGMQKFYDNLIGFEEDNKLKESAFYIPQDHAIHSVSLYLLGLYLYFNSTVFHNSIATYFRSLRVSSEFDYSIEEYAFLNFISAWKGFSLLHDIAYPYESMFDTKGQKNNDSYNSEYVSLFKNIDALTIYFTSVECFSQVILADILFNNTIELLDYEFICLNNNFEKFNHTEGKGSFSNYVMQFQGYRKLRYANNYNDFEFIRKWFSYQDILTIVRDNFYNPVAIIVWQDESENIYIEESYIKEVKDLSLTNSIKCEQKQFRYDIYVSDNGKKRIEQFVRNFNLSARYTQIQKISEDICNHISIDLATVGGDSSYMGILYSISKIIMEKCPFEINEKPIFGIDNLKVEHQLLKNIVIERITKVYSDLIDKKLKEYACHKANKTSYTDAEVDNIFVEMRNLFTCENYFAFEKECKDDFYHSKGKQEALVNDYNEIFSKIRNVFEGCEFSDDYIKYDDCVEAIINISDDKLTRDILRNLFGDKIEHLLCEEDYIDSKVPFEKFFTYRTPYSMFDHGVMASVVVRYYLYSKDIREKYLKEKGKINFSCKNVNTPQLVLDEMIYAILVHNIYSNVYSQCCDKQPIHSLLINPFSYFAMFCDNLQVWDREVRINHGLIDWDGYTLYGEDISMVCEQQKIRILCKTDNIIKSFYKLKNDMDDYLLNASEIISLGLIER